MSLALHVVGSRAEQLEQREERRGIAVLEADARARGPTLQPAPDPDDLSLEREGIPAGGGYELHGDDGLGFEEAESSLGVEDLEARAAEAEIADADIARDAPHVIPEGRAEVHAPPSVRAEVVPGCRHGSRSAYTMGPAAGVHYGSARADKLKKIPIWFSVRVECNMPAAAHDLSETRRPCSMELDPDDPGHT